MIRSSAEFDPRTLALVALVAQLGGVVSEALFELGTPSAVIVAVGAVLAVIGFVLAWRAADRAPTPRALKTLVIAAAGITSSVEVLMVGVLLR